MLVFLRSGPCRCRAPPALRLPQFSLTFAPHFYGARHGGEHAFAAETRALLKACPVTTATSATALHVQETGWLSI